MLSSLKFVCNSCCGQNQVKMKTRKGENLRWLRDGRRRVRPLRIAHACFRSPAKPVAYRHRPTIRHAIGLGPPVRDGSRQGLIVIFLSSHLAWSKQTLTLPPTSQAGIKVIKRNGMLKLTAGKARSAYTTERVLFGAPMPIFGIMRRLYQS